MTPFANFLGPTTQVALVDPFFTFEESAVCFEDGCAVSVEFPALSSNLELLQQATLTVFFTGDFGASFETLDVDLNGQDAGACNSVNSDCSDDFEECVFDVLSSVSSGQALVVTLDASARVSSICADADFQNYAFRAVVHLTIECAEAWRGTSFGCEGAPSPQPVLQQSAPPSLPNHNPLSFSFVDTGVCFTDNCAVVVQFQGLSDNVDKILIATLSVYFNGDFGQFYETLQVTVNGREVGECSSQAGDCDPSFDRCDFDVLSDVGSSPLEVALASSIYVNALCVDGDLENFALRARVELVITCEEPLVGSATGCVQPASLPPTVKPTFSPTARPTTLAPTPYDPFYTYVATAVCFDDSCSVVIEVPEFTDNLDQLLQATLTLFYRGDLGASFETLDVLFNSQQAGTCQSSAGDCNPEFESCSFNVLSLLTSGSSLVVTVASSNLVDAVCSDADFTGYAFRVRLEVTIECAFPFLGTVLGCTSDATPSPSAVPSHPPSAQPTVRPFPVPTSRLAAFTFFEAGVCFEDGCAVSVQFPSLGGSNLGAVEQAVLTIFFKGDLGAAIEFLNVEINANDAGTCQSAANDCNSQFETCIFNVLPQLLSGAPLDVTLDSTATVNDICDDNQFSNFAVRAEFEVTITCADPFRATSAGCAGTASPTVTPAPSAIPTAPTLPPSLVPVPAPTTMPSLVPISAPTPLPSATPVLAPTALPSTVPTPEPSTVPIPAPSSLPTLIPSIGPTDPPTPVPFPVPSTPPTALPTPAPSTYAPTVVPSPAPTPVDTSFTFEIGATACFADGCTISVQFPPLTSLLDELVVGTLTVFFRGDLGQSSREFFDVFVNGQSTGDCKSSLVDCNLEFETCTFDVLTDIASGSPLVVDLVATDNVDSVCDDTNLVDYALQARFELTIDCDDPYTGDSFGCVTSRAPTLNPALVPTAMPSLAPVLPSPLPSGTPTSSTPTVPPTTIPTFLPTNAPTLLPTSGPSDFVPSFIFTEAGVCFANGCAFSVEFPALSDFLNQLQTATLSVFVKGDIGQLNEVVEVLVNGQSLDICESDVDDCSPAFGTCTVIDVLTEAASGAPLVVGLDATPGVTGICDDADFENFALRASFELKIQCSEPFKATETGCMVSSAPTLLPTIVPTPLPSLQPIIATPLPTLMPSSTTPTILPTPVPTIFVPVFTFEESGVCLTKGCAVTLSFPALSDSPDQLQTAALSIAFAGDLGQVNEVLDVLLNGNSLGGCQSALLDCEMHFDLCTFNVLPEATLGTPLNVTIDASSFVDPICTNSEFTNFALLAMATLTIECTEPFQGSETGCKTTSPPSSDPSSVPTPMPSGVPLPAPTPPLTSGAPTMLPTPGPTQFVDSFTFEAASVCFTDGCGLSVQFPALTALPSQLSKASLTMLFKGDLGQANEVLDVVVNGTTAGSCQSALLDCSMGFESCTFDVLATAALGKPIDIDIEASSAVSAICSDSNFANFAVQAQFEMRIECAPPYLPSQLGCVTTVPPSPIPTATNVPSVVPVPAPTSLSPTVSPSLLPTPVPTKFVSSFTFEESGVCFEDGCDIVVQYPQLSDKPNQLQTATLTIFFSGDLGQANEWVDVSINGQFLGTCRSEFLDCSAIPDTCTFDVLTDLSALEAPLVVTLDASDQVDAICDDPAYTGFFSLEARVELTIECVSPFLANTTGCIGTAFPTLMPVATSSPTALPSAPPTLPPTPGPTPAFVSFTYEQTGECFDDACDITAQFAAFSDEPNVLLKATLTVYFTGDLGQYTSEYVTVYVNDQNFGRCRSFSTIDCDLQFESCTVDVPANSVAGVPIVAKLESSPSVNDICSDDEFSGYAIRARFVLTVQCSENLLIGETTAGCLSASAVALSSLDMPTTSPPPSLAPTLAS